MLPALLAEPELQRQMPVALMKVVAKNSLKSSTDERCPHGLRHSAG